MEHSEWPAGVVARVVITHLRQSVQGRMDADRVLPADGSCLLATLDRVLAGPDGESAAAAGGVIDTTNPFFQSLGTNGRACVTCHQPADEWTVTPAHLQSRFGIGLTRQERANLVAFQCAL